MRNLKKGGLIKWYTSPIYYNEGDSNYSNKSNIHQTNFDLFTVHVLTMAS